MATLDESKSTDSLMENLPLFDPGTALSAPPKVSMVEQQLKDISPDHLSPKQALEHLYVLRAMLNNDDDG